MNLDNNRLRNNIIRYLRLLRQAQVDVMNRWIRRIRIRILLYLDHNGRNLHLRFLLFRRRRQVLIDDHHYRNLPRHKHRYHERELQLSILHYYRVSHLP
jgi:hypothetical protein